MDHVDACARLPELVKTYADTVRGADPSTPVPTCPGWDLAKLTKHLGTVQAWAAAMVRSGSPERVDPRTLDLELPEARDDLPDWLVRRGEALVAALRDADPDADVWAWGADQHVRFWSRRLVHEIAVHTADAQLAVGRPPRFPSDLAPDAVDELLDNLPSAATFSPHVEQLRGDGASIHLHSTDVDGEWMIELQPDGYRWSHGHAKGSVAVRGAAGDLVLLLYRRLDPTAGAPDAPRFAVFGDDAVLGHWLAHSALQ
jgi:uncharacterized protein (TIGR03083 family)